MEIDKRFGEIDFQAQNVPMIGARWIQIAALAVSAIQSSLAVSESVDISKDQQIIFCFFKSVKISPSSFSFFCTTSATNGNETVADGHTPTPANIGIPYHDDLVNRLWHFSIPKEADSASFSIIFKEDGQSWSTTPFFKISSPLFVYDTEDYTTLNPETGWGSLDMSFGDFATFVLSWIDPNSSSSINGYNAYPQIQKAIYSSITDNTDPKTITWNDSFIGKTTVKDKWELIRANYEEHASSRFANVPYYVLGSILLLLSLGLLAVPLWQTRKRRLGHESN